VRQRLTRGWCRRPITYAAVSGPGQVRVKAALSQGGPVAHRCTVGNGQQRAEAVRGADLAPAINMNFLICR
jgi:hypothetical protein